MPLTSNLKKPSPAFLTSVDIFVDTFKENLVYQREICPAELEADTILTYLAIPSIVIILVSSFCQRRKILRLDLCGGRMGLVYPINIFTRDSRLEYCCSFGLAACSAYERVILFTFFKENLWTLTIVMEWSVSFLIYATLFFNIASAFSSKTALSYFFSSLFVWIIMVVRFNELASCQKNDNFVVMVIKMTPTILCLSYLAVKTPYLLLKAIQSKEYVERKQVQEFQTVEQIRESFQGKHVRKLLKHPVQQIVDPTVATKENFIDKLHKIYREEKGFKYPTILVTILFVAAMIIYVMTIDFLVLIIPHLNNILSKSLAALERIGYVAVDGELPSVTNTRESLHLVFNITQCVLYSLMAALPLSSFTLIVSSLHSLISFRSRVDMLFSLSVISIHHGVYHYSYWNQLAMVLVGLHIMRYDVHDLHSTHSTNITSKDLLPAGKYSLSEARQQASQIKIVLFSLMLFMLLFLLEMLDTRFFFITIYYLFLFNILSGFVSCMIRIIKSCVVSFVAVSKMDICMLPRKIDLHDPGFAIYHGFIHLEASHNNPVMQVFIGLLIAMSKNRKVNTPIEDSGSPYPTPFQQKKSRTFSNMSYVGITREFSAARFTWLVAYTLIHNPTIRIYRRGFIQLLNAAIRDGLKVPLSDRPIYFILTQIQCAQKNKKKSVITKQKLMGLRKNTNRKKSHARKSTFHSNSEHETATDFTNLTSTEASSSK
ncbi:stimulated by retinoic acid 6 protein [Biomphalaria pfeifferi]|uniref:Stimulated by retinoic acid 6 protein n=1 Tax=Biomphalaria pfeifferi TaxID=112525 RepID=A0AAD8ARN8_BIOPF|nr:stimulated by retinoic acid 6 protein [Biomphalaria pfeifferi]